MAISSTLVGNKSKSSSQYDTPKATPPSRKIIKSTSGSGNMGSDNSYTYRNGETRFIDPVVAQLKAKRKLENEQKMKKMENGKNKRGSAASKALSSTSNSAKTPASSSRKQPSVASAVSSASPRRPIAKRVGKSRIPPSQLPQPKTPSQPVKKLNFSELMKQAGKIDTSKLSINPVKPKSKSPINTMIETKTARISNNTITEKNRTVSSKSKRETLKTNYSGVNSFRQAKGSTSSAAGIDREISSKVRTSVASDKPAKITHPLRKPSGPIPIAKPSATLAEKIKAKKKKLSRYEEDYEDDSDFIVSDDEVDEIGYGGGKSGPGYDRDEIWSIFNKGKKRTYYEDDYDSDDMEATGADILEEEDESARRARLEEKREEEAEKRRVAAKKAKLQGRG